MPDVPDGATRFWRTPTCYFLGWGLRFPAACRTYAFAWKRWKRRDQSGSISTRRPAGFCGWWRGSPRRRSTRGWPTGRSPAPKILPLGPGCARRRSSSFGVDEEMRRVLRRLAQIEAVDLLDLPDEPAGEIVVT